jgi:FMN-dependent NADH-azoreductase
MATLLHIDSSPRGAETSVSRRLTREFVASWRASHPDGRVVYRDLGKETVPLVTSDWVNASYTPPDQRNQAHLEVLRYSDTAVDELLAADVIVIGAPMHNFNIPTSLKAYIDQIARAGRTFAYTAKGPEGLAKGKKLFVITARGGLYGPGSPAEALNQQTPYLKTFFAFIGITDVTFIDAEAQGSAQHAPTQYNAALSQVQQLAI